MIVSNFAKYLALYVILSFALLTFFDHLDFINSKSAFKCLLQSNKLKDLKYILLWSNKFHPIKTICEGQNLFRRCSFTNCYLSTNKQLFGDVADYDVILFHGPELPGLASLLPQSRSPRQKYTFFSRESSARFPVCNKIYNNSYFNWTMTYRLDSEVYNGYISIRDKKGKVIGPKEEMHWLKVEAMMPINDKLKAKLSTKKIAAAWFVSNCRAPSGRNLIARQLNTELAKYNMQVDVFGKCGTKKCPRDQMKKCLRKLETDYYFYLSFENSFDEDYVTEKLLHALNHYAVPVVYGGANYTRFMPDGIYLTARNSGIKELAKEMVDIINDKQKYYDFFKWHNHYSYDPYELGYTEPYCRLCTVINSKKKYSRTSVYKDFSEWWNPPRKCL